MIHYKCVECQKEAKFKTLSEAFDSGWYVLGISMNLSSYMSICSSCDDVGVGHKGKSNKKENNILETKKKELKNSNILSYE